MRIAIYKDTFANNRGADVAVRNLAAGLAGRGHATVLFEKPDLAKRLGERWDVLISAGTNELLDLAAANVPLPPVVQQFQTEPAYSFRHWLRRWRRNRAIWGALRRVSAIQVLRPIHATWLRAHAKGLSASCPVAVIGNWADFDVPVPMPESVERLIICPGAINKDKNQRLLVKAFLRLAREFPEWSLDLYGKARPRDEAGIRRFLASIPPRADGTCAIRLQGFCDLSEVYARCAFVAFPSRTEGFPLAVIEAAAFGKPAVMIHDWIGTAAAGGGIVTEQTVSAYAAALRRLMADSALCAEMGRTARLFCNARFSRAKILDQWEALLENVVN